MTVPKRGISIQRNAARGVIVRDPEAEETRIALKFPLERAVLRVKPQNKVVHAPAAPAAIRDSPTSWRGLGDRTTAPNCPRSGPDTGGREAGEGREKAVEVQAEAGKQKSSRVIASRPIEMR
ncbi:hypothetical protein [Palleronia abyssalis]|uniref:hypothetical protein n=1 Tax=Palleronia abyssalis TaxID=1501240 RepID=UPI0011B2244A|nr:hypothetical protein [Palleronia abyssalis]